MRRRKGDVPTEYSEQVKLIAWLTKNAIPHFAIPNGGYRNAIEGMRLKASGVSPGVPDICIPVPAGSYHGLWIELKRITGGRISDVQQHWLDYLNGAGYLAEVAKGFAEAQDIVIGYLRPTMTHTPSAT